MQISDLSVKLYDNILAVPKKGYGFSNSTTYCFQFQRMKFHNIIIKTFLHFPFCILMNFKELQKVV